MKQSIILLIFSLILLGCGKEKGDVDISGYLMHHCGSADPIGGAAITFTINGTDLITTKTDAFGYFRLKGSYEYKSSFGHDSFNYITYLNNSNGFGSLKVACSVPNRINLDTIYEKNSTLLRVTIIPPSGGYGETGDSLYVGYGKPLYMRSNSNDHTLWLSFPLPIYDTIVLEPKPVFAASHIGYTMGNCGSTSVGVLYGKTKNYNQGVGFDWVREQPNKACGRVYNITIDLKE